ncbi:hypothetical protein [Fontivita pretiosa]|uniref:hypothetical protein n=1 Tax=Fontivita pretiosa TaxID=2989684 RepID=UPI003D16816F
MTQMNPLSFRDDERRTIRAVHSIVVVTVVLLCGCMKGTLDRDRHDDHPAIAQPPNTTEFVFNGQPIHPALVHLFEGRLADRDAVVRVVDLDAAFGTDQFRSPVRVEHSQVRTSWHSGDLEQTYSYQHLGVLSNRYHVLRTFYNTGGTGIFQSVLFVEFAKMPSTYAGEGDHQVLRLVRTVPLGDRDDARVEVVNNEVRFGASRYRKEPVVLRAP